MDKKFIITIILVTFLGKGFSQSSSVASISPEQNELNVPVNTLISITFNTEMNPVMINDTTFFVQGSVSGLHQGAIGYGQDTKTATFYPAVNFEEGEIVTVSLTREVQTNQGVPLDSGYTWLF